MGGPFYTIPPQQELTHHKNGTPEYMFPSDLPFAVVCPSFLTGEECDKIVERCMLEETYTFGSCGAVTREIESLQPDKDPLAIVEYAARRVNSAYWEFDLAPQIRSWFQTYEKHGEYSTHVDAAPGQTRKLTAVAMLSSEDDYTGGILEVEWPPRTYQIPRERGTIAFFPSTLAHRVTTVWSGTRQTLNMGFWGPPFR